ncbi:MAG: ABC transporter permease [Planctomycetes bacterium]|nr:ABC transporter permease [Planctomycetota bacterium]
MLAYTVRRLLIAGVTLVLISFVVYGLIRAMPGDPAVLARMGMEEGQALPVNDERFQEMRAAYGLDKAWPRAYLLWLGDLARGHLGTSLHQHVPVTGIILEKAGPTLLLTVISLGLSYILSIPLGLYAARRAGRPDERALSAVLYMLYSIPSYVAAVYLLLVFSVNLDLLPLFGMRGPEHETLSAAGKAWDLFQHLILPVTCYTYGTLAYYARFIRANLAEVLRQDYIRAARAKGLGETAVLVRHAFRNALIPFVTLLGLTLPALLSGSVILEQIFSWPGMGREFFHAIATRDYPLIMGLTMVFSVLILVGTLLADLLYAVVDPRISYS